LGQDPEDLCEIIDLDQFGGCLRLDEPHQQRVDLLIEPGWPDRPVPLRMPFRRLSALPGLFDQIAHLGGLSRYTSSGATF
jgi:hypothetical protein